MLHPTILSTATNRHQLANQLERGVGGDGGAHLQPSDQQRNSAVNCSAVSVGEGLEKGALSIPDA